MRKRLRQREKKRKPGLFKFGKTILEIGKYAWRCDFFLSSYLTSIVWQSVAKYEN